jgi:antitoxin YefM
MSVETTYSHLREHLASILDRVVDDREVVIVKRKKGGKDVALIAADELAGLLETAHLLQSPKNARRIRESLQELDKIRIKPEPVEKLKREMRLGER